jgi:hypothetical protein
MQEPGCLCKQKSALLREFSFQVDRMNSAVQDWIAFARSDRALRKILRQRYEEEKAAAHNSHQRYFEHRREHGC